MRAIRPADESAADESAVQATRPVVQGAIRLAAILGVLSTAALLGVVSVAAGLGVAGWIAGLATGWAATALIVIARLRSDQPDDIPGGLGHPDPGGVVRRGRGPGRRLVVAGPAGVEHSAGYPFRRRASARRGGRAGGAPDRHRHLTGRPYRWRGRRLPHPAAQHRRVAGVWQLGAGHRRRSLRAAAGGLADPVAGRAVATPVLAQGRGRGPGHRAHHRRIRTGRPPHRDDRGCRRVAAPGRVVRPRRDLAVPHRRRPAHSPGTAGGHWRARDRARVE